MSLSPVLRPLLRPVLSRGMARANLGGTPAEPVPEGEGIALDAMQGIAITQTEQVGIQVESLQGIAITQTAYP